MRAPRAVLLAALLLPLAGCVESPPEIVPEALLFLRSAQNDDGGFPGTPGGPSDFTTSAWVALAFASADVQDEGTARLGRFLAQQSDAVRNGTTGSLSRVNPLALYVLAKSSLGHEGADLAPELRAYLPNASLGLNERIFLLGALGRLGDRPQALHDRLREEVAQNRTSPATSDAWFRANAILALLASGGSGGDPYYREAARSLLLFQKQGSGFHSSPEYPPDASTTSAVIAVLHRVPFVYSDEVTTGRAFLEKLQDEEGWIRFSEASDFGRVKTTAEAVIGFTGTGPFGA